MFQEVVEDEHNDSMESMLAHKEEQDNGKVGIFWYDVRHNALFGLKFFPKQSLKFLMNLM